MDAVDNVTWQIYALSERLLLISAKDILFSLLRICLWAINPIGLNGRNDALFAEKCIRIVCEKLTLFPYGQDIVGNIILLAFRWYSQVQDRSEGFREMYKYVTLISSTMDLPHHAMQQWRHGIGQQKGSFNRHYCVANSFGRYMHSLSTF